MQIKRFYAISLPAAMRDIRRTLGPDAVIVTTRNLTTDDDMVVVNGGHRALVEVTAAREAPEPASSPIRPRRARSALARERRPSPRPASGPEARPSGGKPGLSARQAMPQTRTERVDSGGRERPALLAAAPAPRNGGNGALRRAALAACAQHGKPRNGGNVSGRTLVALREELQSIQRRLDSLDGRPPPGSDNAAAPIHPYIQRAALPPAPSNGNGTGRHEDPKIVWSPPPGPAPFLEDREPLPSHRRFTTGKIEEILRRQGVDEMLGRRLLDRMRHVSGRDAVSRIDPETRGTFGHWVSAVEDFLPGPVNGNGAKAKPRTTPEGSARPRQVALVGPTGVGKTTTIAKLASRFALSEGKEVGLVTLDTYRVGATEQLKTYAKLLGVRLEVVAEPSQLGPALESMSAMDVVLIDTPGHSPRDGAAMARLAAMVGRDHGLEVHLMLPAALRGEEMRHVIERFKPMNFSEVIFSKLDEANAWGEVLNAWIMRGFRVSYFTTGQRVPEDIEPASAESLCQCLLGGDV